MNEALSDKINLTIFIGVAVMVLLMISFLVIVSLTQRRKWKMLREVQELKEQQQNLLIESAVRSEEVERHRIAELLHDEVGALLSSSRIFLVEMNTQHLPLQDKKDHAKVKEIIDESIQKVRGISHNLHSTILKEFGLNEAIRHFMSKITGATAVTSTIELDDNYSIANPEKDLAIYRIIQELVNNLLKYAQSDKILISSELKQNELWLQIQHNGDGLSQAQFEEMRYKSEGLGLKNIQNRIILLKGKILFTIHGINNCSIELFIPV